MIPQLKSSGIKTEFWLLCTITAIQWLLADWRGEMDASGGESVTEWGRQSGSDRLGVWGTEIRRKVVTPDLAEVSLTNHPAHLSSFICYLLLTSLCSSCMHSFLRFQANLYTAQRSLLTKKAGHISEPRTGTNIAYMPQAVQFHVAISVNLFSVEFIKCYSTDMGTLCYWTIKCAVGDAFHLM